jgi:hypothetical protein
MLNIIILSAIGTGTVCLFSGWVWMLLVSRKIDTWWFAGIAFLFMFVGPLFAIFHWNVAKRPFLLSIVGAVLAYGTVFIVPAQK